MSEWELNALLTQQLFKSYLLTKGEPMFKSNKE